MNVALVCCIKNENQYLEEWVNYNINIGFSHIYLCDNNDIEGEHITDIIKNNNKITIIDIKGKEYTPHFQEKIYSDMYLKYGEEYDYIAFFDADEFLTLEKWNNINDMLNDKLFSKYDAIAVSWKTYDDNNIIENKQNSIKVFTNEIKNKESKDNFRVKTIYKTKNNLLYNNIGVHCSCVKIKLCNVKGNEISWSKFPMFWHITENAYIKHYKYRGFDDFLKKLERFCYDKPHQKQLIEEYFLSNQKTDNKINLINKIVK